MVEEGKVHTVSDMYRFITKGGCDTIKELRSLLGKERHIVAEARKVLITYKVFINKHLNCNLDDILEVMTTDHSSIEYQYKRLGDPVGYKNALPIVKEAAKNYIEHSLIIKDKEDQLNSLESSFVSEDVYRHILESFNKKMVSKMIGGYVFYIGANIGEIRIVIRDQVPKKDINGKNRLKINWGASNKYKQKLIDEGKTPFDKETAPEGHDWFIYYTERFPYFRWKKRSDRNRLKNRSVFSFRPTQQVVQNVLEYLKKNPHATVNLMQ